MTTDLETTAVPAPGPPGAVKRTTHPGLALVVICFAQLMVVLDATIVNVALPSIQRGLHFSVDDLVWVTTAYSLTFGGLLIFGGRTGDLFGRRRMFMTGIAVFATASLLGGLAQDSTWLILTRACQGMGAAIASPTALSLIATNFPEGSARSRAMGVYAAVSGAGGGIGLLAGGLLVDFVGWRWIFFVNVPIGALVLLVAPRVLNEGRGLRRRLDWRGAVTVTVGMALLVYGLTNASSHSWGSASTVGPLVAAGVLLVGFVLMQLRSTNALMPLRIFANRSRSGTYATMLLLGAGLFSILYFLTLFMQDIQGYSPLRTGVAYLPFVGALVVASQLSSRLVPRVGPRVLLPAGTALAAGGMFWLHTLTVGMGYVGLLGPFLLIGFGMGLAFVPLTLGALTGVAPEDSGLASALLNTGQQVGGAIGLAALSTLAVTEATSDARALAAEHHGTLSAHLSAVATTQGYSDAFLVATGLIAAACLVAVVTVGLAKPTS